MRNQRGINKTRATGFLLLIAAGVLFAAPAFAATDIPAVDGLPTIPTSPAQDLLGDQTGQGTVNVAPGANDEIELVTDQAPDPVKSAVPDVPPVTVHSPVQPDFDPLDPAGTLNAILNPPTDDGTGGTGGGGGGGGGGGDGGGGGGGTGGGGGGTGGGGGGGGLNTLTGGIGSSSSMVGGQGASGAIATSNYGRNSRTTGSLFGSRRTSFIDDGSSIVERARQMVTPMTVPFAAALLGLLGVGMIAKGTGRLDGVDDEKEAIGGWTVIRL